jgi:hypothetical protein
MLRAGEAAGRTEAAARSTPWAAAARPPAHAEVGGGGGVEGGAEHGAEDRSKSTTGGQQRQREGDVEAERHQGEGTEPAALWFAAAHADEGGGGEAEAAGPREHGAGGADELAGLLREQEGAGGQGEEDDGDGVADADDLADERAAGCPGGHVLGARL